MAPDGDGDWAAIDDGPTAVTTAATPSPAATARAGDDDRRPEGPLPLGPMAFADILDGAFTLYRANARTLVTASAAILLPVQLLTEWFNRNVGAALFGSDFTTGGFSVTSSTSGSSFLVTVAAGALVLTLLAGVACRVAAASYFGGTLGPGAALRLVLRRWPALIAAWALVHLAEAVGLVVAFFPGLLVMALFVATTPAIVIEGLGPIAGMKRSARLAGRRLFPILGVALGSAIVVSAVDLALGWIPSVLGAVAGPWGWVLRAAAGTLAGVVTAPYVALVATLVYFDARIRVEGMDVAVLASRLRSDARA